MAEQSAWQRSITSFSNALNHLEQQLNTHLNRFTPFRNLYLQIFKSTDKFASSLLTIADTCDQEILTACNNKFKKVTEYEQPLSASYQHLRTGMIGIVQAWRQVAVRSRNQIIEPLKIFNDNYRKLCVQGITQMKKNLASCVNAQAQVLRNRQNYYGCCEKLERHKEGQVKLMLRIENGEPGALEKFNKTTKTLLERVSSAQRTYSESVDRANQLTSALRSHATRQTTSLRHNEASRAEFLKKIADSQMRILELGKNMDFSHKNEIQPKIESKGKHDLGDSMARLQKWAGQQTVQVYISHDQLVKSRKQKQFQQENPLLAELFQKVKQSQKPSLAQFVCALLQLEPGVRLISIQKPPREGRLVFPPQWETFREKILSLQHYCFYFVHLLSRQLAELPNYYLKLTPPFFYHLHDFIRKIIQQLDTQAEGGIGEASIATIYQTLKIAERIVQKKQGRVRVGGMKTLIESLGQCGKLRDLKTMQKLGRFLIKRSQKKKGDKGVMGFTKGLFSTLTGKRQQGPTNQQQQFNALVELTQIMANLTIPTQISLPYLKNILKSNEPSYQYLKDILLSKRDRQQRQKLLLNQNSRTESLKHLLQGTFSLKVIAGINIVAQRGFLSIQCISLRTLCRGLSKIHLNVIYRIKAQMSFKWKILSHQKRGQLYKQLNGNPEKAGKPTQVQDIIQLDIQRSLQMHHEQLPSQQLKKFLVFYAREHPDMPYCQGMNYVAGFMLLKIPDPINAYCSFTTAMHQLFLPVFKDNFSGMRVKLYLMDRLLAIFHPDISDHLRREMITPQCYSVGWIITAFSSAYQYTKSSFLVDWFWQRFMLWGWSQFYRLTLWLFQIYRDSLIGAGYDKCLQVFGELTRCPALLASTKEAFLASCPGDLEGAFQSFAVSNELMQRLVRQFEHE